MVAVRFICGGNHRTRRKPPTCRKSLTNFITYNVVYLALVENRAQGLWEGGSTGTLVRGPGSQEGACESLKGPIALDIDVLFCFVFFPWGGGGLLVYLELCKIHLDFWILGKISLGGLAQTHNISVDRHWLHIGIGI
jgi:hypothetical protein